MEPNRFTTCCHGLCFSQPSSTVVGARCPASMAVLGEAGSAEGDEPRHDERAAMVRYGSPVPGQVRAAVLLLAVVFAALWLNIRRPSTAVHREPHLATPAASMPAAPPVVLCAICRKPITGPVMVWRYDDGATDRLHPACYTRAKSDPPVKVAK
jgi:hypothetical protein